MSKTLTKQRNIRKPAGFETEEMEGYFRLPKKAAAIAIVKKLSGTQLRLWLYLMMEDPFADLTADGEKIYHDIPSPVEIALKIGANQETVEKDMRVLKKLGLYDYRSTGWEGYNLSAAEANAEAERLKQRKKVAETRTAKGGGLNNPQEGLNNPSERLNNPQEGLNNPSERLNNPSKTLEPLPQADSKTPQTSSDSLQTFQTTTDKDDAAAVEKNCSNPNSPVSQPTQEEVEQAHQEIARISPEIEINSQVKRLILEFWGNLPAAIAHTKKAVREPWCKNPTGVLCKSLKNPSEGTESAAIEIKKELPNPNKEQRAELQKLGKPAGIEMPDGLIAEAIDFGGGRVLPWWRALNIPFEQLQQP